MRRIGLFGGTFDPVHKAHIRLAVTCREDLSLDEVWLMVSPQNPWKRDMLMTSDHHRLMMARLAVEGQDGIVASDYELHLPSPSYTYKTLRRLRSDFPDDRFILLVGGDNWAAFDKWAEYREILAFHPVAVYPRPGSPVSTPAAVREAGGSPIVLDAQQMDISSSGIRRRIADGMDISGLVPEAVRKYIHTNHLYGKNNNTENL
ncbi:MAG: nicotinate (nicotinamide) nucleotide adenylyltransferase [Prevotella sp.]